MDSITKEELYRFHLDSKKALEGYRNRKRAAHNIKFPVGKNVISVLAMFTLPVLVTIYA